MIFTVLLCCFLLFNPLFIKTSENTHKITTFNSLPPDALRHISEFCTDSPINPLRFVNKFTYTTLPSVQDFLAQKFNCKSFQKLPGTPELFHLINFQYNINGLIQDHTRFLQLTRPLIIEAVIEKFMDGSLDLDDNLLKIVIDYVIDKKNAHLFAKLLARVPVSSLHNLPKDFLLESLENIAQNNLIEAFSSNVDGGNANYFATVLILSNLTIEEILNRVENLDLELVTIFESFLDTIVQIKPTVENHYKYQKLSFKLLDKTDDTRYQTIAQMLICLKFDHQFFNVLDYEKMLKEFGQFFSQTWRDNFLLVSIQMHRFDVGRLTISLKSHQRSAELQQVIATYPQLLQGFSRKRISSILGVEYLNYRIRNDPQDFDSHKQITNSDDVIVSAYIHSDQKFISVLSRMTSEDFREWGAVLDRFFADPSLIDKLIILANSFSLFANYPELVFSQMNFAVFREVLLRLDEFTGLFDHRFNYKIMIPPEVMAQVLRDNQLYRILRDNKNLLFPKIFFSFIDAVNQFTLYDWERMFALSDDDLVFERHNAENTLNNASNPIQCVTLDLHLDMIKYNFVDLLILGNSIASINRSPQKRILYDPLLQLWAKTDPVSYKQNFPESKEIN